MFFSGLTSPSRDHRERFLKAFNAFALTGKGLFARVNLVLDMDVTFLSHNYWIPAALNIVLGSVALSLKAKVSSNGAQHKDLMAPVHKPEESTVLPGLPGDRHQRVLMDVKKVVNMLNGSLTSGALLSPLLNLVHLDGSRRLAEVLWVETFPRMWQLFSEDQRLRLSLGIRKFLSNRLHKSQRSIVSEAIQCRIIQMKQTSATLAKMVTAELKSEKIFGTTIDPYVEVLMASSIKRLPLWQRAARLCRKNVVHTLLKGIMECNPMPLLSTELLQFISSRHACAHLVLHIAEGVLAHKIHELTVAARSKSIPTNALYTVRNWLSSLAPIYANMLRESDLHSGLLRLQSAR